MLCHLVHAVNMSRFFLPSHQQWEMLFFLTLFLTRAPFSSDAGSFWEPGLLLQDLGQLFPHTARKTLLRDFFLFYFLLEMKIKFPLSSLQDFSEQLEMSDYETQLKYGQYCKTFFFHVCCIYLTCSPIMFTSKK